MRTGYNAAKQQLTAHPDTTIWLSYSNDNMKGVYKALTDAGVANDDPGYFLAGMDVTNEDLDLIQLPNSIYRMAFAFRSETLATVNENFLVAAAEGQPLDVQRTSSSIRNSSRRRPRRTSTSAM